MSIDDNNTKSVFNLCINADDDDELRSQLDVNMNTGKFQDIEQTPTGLLEKIDDKTIMGGLLVFPCKTGSEAKVKKVLDTLINDGKYKGKFLRAVRVQMQSENLIY